MRRRRCWASHGFRRKTSSSSSATKNSKLSEQKHLVNWSPCKPNFMIHWDFGAQAHTSADDIFNSVVHRKWDGIRPWKRTSRNPSSATLHLGLFYNNTELNAGGMAASTTATLRKSQLRSFVDAAPKGGYGAVAYRRQVNRDGDVHISFIASKSHVIPLNPKRASHHNSVPRVEIVSAEKAVQLKRFVGKTINLDNLIVRFWSDSESALKMIYNPAKPKACIFRQSSLQDP